MANFAKLSYKTSTCLAIFYYGIGEHHIEEGSLVCARFKLTEQQVEHYKNLIAGDILEIDECIKHLEKDNRSAFGSAESIARVSVVCGRDVENPLARYFVDGC